MAAVDDAHQVVIEAQAFGEPQEVGLLTPMLDGIEENLNAIGDKAPFKGTQVVAEMESEPNGTFVYSDFPHNEVRLINNGVCIAKMPAHLISMICNDISDTSLRDLEVVYVGMSYGQGNRAAPDRLRSHSTLQQVLADMSADEPENEALLILVEYAPLFSAISFDPRNSAVNVGNDRDAISDLRKQQELIDRKTEIALAEAGLIKYFKPHYNEKYKNNFPDRGHAITLQR